MLALICLLFGLVCSLTCFWRSSGARAKARRRETRGGIGAGYRSVKESGFQSALATELVKSLDSGSALKTATARDKEKESGKQSESEWDTAKVRGTALE